MKNKWLLLSISLILLWLTFMLFVQHWKGWFINFEAASQYGTLAGGILSFISVVLIYNTLQHQTESFTKTHFETRFFELIRYHRDNVEKMKYKLPNEINEVYEEGDRVFIVIHKQILEAIKIVEDEYNNALNHSDQEGLIDKIYRDKSIRMNTETYSEFLTRRMELKDINKLNIYNIAYLIVFFGVHREGKSALKKILTKKYNQTLIENIIQKASGKIAMWDEKRYFRDHAKYTVDSKDKKKPIPYKYFGGHQHRLGKYFRHLYQSVNYVNEVKEFSYPDKYSYTKTLRAQLSNYEQSVIFFNSISDIGNIWELKVESPLNSSNKEVYKVNRQLITKYNFIKNILYGFIPDVEIMKFYPDVKFEGENDTINKVRLIKLYY